MDLQAVVFDFDGLIVDTEWPIYTSAPPRSPSSDRAPARDVGHDRRAGGGEGRLVRHAVRAAGRRLARADFDRVYQAQDRSDRDRLPVLPGVTDLLDALDAAGVPAGIASSSEVALARTAPRSPRSARPVRGAGRSRPGRRRGKPAPDSYLLACRELGAEPARRWRLEDSAHGVAAARAAGMAVVAVPSRITRLTSLTDADLVVDSLTDLSVGALDDLVQTEIERRPLTHGPTQTIWGRKILADMPMMPPKFCVSGDRASAAAMRGRPVGASLRSMVMRPSDIGRLVSVSDPSVSPDGGTVAFVVTRVDMDANRYRSAVWLAAADGSSPPRQITVRRGGGQRPTWSPDGRTLAFTSRRKKDDKGDKRSTLHLLAVDRPGETVTLVDLPEGISDVHWSPDGSRIAFMARKRGKRWEEGDDDASRPPRRIDHFFSRLDSVGWIIDRPTQIWVGPSDGSAPPEPVTDGPYEHGAPAWSPDGSKLAFTAARHDRWDLDRPVEDLWVLDLNDDGDTRRPAPGHRVLVHPPTRSSWSPDGSRLAALASEEIIAPGLPSSSWSTPTSGKSEELARSLDRSCAPYPGARSPIWDGDRLWFARRGRRKRSPLPRAAADGSSEPERMVEGERAIGGYDLAGGTLAVRRHLTDRAARAVHDHRWTERRLTSLGSGFHRSHPALAPERFSVPSPPAVTSMPGSSDRRLRTRTTAEPPDAAQRPRRTDDPVRQRLVRRVPALGISRLRRRLRQSAWIHRVHRGVGCGPSGHRSPRRRRARAGAVSTTRI